MSVFRDAVQLFGCCWILNVSVLIPHDHPFFFVDAIELKLPNYGSRYQKRIQNQICQEIPDVYLCSGPMACRKTGAFKCT
jgi:hypothetical protein